MSTTTAPGGWGKATVTITKMIHKAFCPRPPSQPLVKHIKKIKGPDNPTNQFLPIMSNTCCSKNGEGRKDKGGGGRSRCKTSCM
jgi:hypothetical protein